MGRGDKISLYYKQQEVNLMDISCRTGYVVSYIEDVLRRYMKQSKYEGVPAFFKRYFGNFRIKKGEKLIIPPIYNDDISKLEDTVKGRVHSSSFKNRNSHLFIQDFTQRRRAEMVIIQLKKKYKSQSLGVPEVMFELGLSGREVGGIYLTNKLPDMTLESVARYYVEFIEWSVKDV